MDATTRLIAYKPAAGSNVISISDNNMVMATLAHCSGGYCWTIVHNSKVGGYVLANKVYKTVLSAGRAMLRRGWDVRI